MAEFKENLGRGTWEAVTPSTHKPVVTPLLAVDGTALSTEL
jgi:hypothetical protein